MHKRYHAQRHHIIGSLESVLYQLHTLSFFLSPSILLYVCRLFCQFLCSNPRELDSNRALRWFYGIILLTHSSGLWTHAVYGAAEGRALVLDFVGIAQTPSKLQLCSLDITILLIQCLLTTITYETSVYYHSDDANAVDVLLPQTSAASLDSSGFDALSSPSTPSYPPKPLPTPTGPPLVLDFQLSSIKTHLTTPPPVPSRSTTTTSTLPLPNTTPFPLPTGFRLLMRARRQAREARNTGNTGETAETPTQARRAARDRQLPGAIDLPE